MKINVREKGERKLNRCALDKGRGERRGEVREREFKQRRGRDLKQLTLRQ